MQWQCPGNSSRTPRDMHPLMSLACAILAHEPNGEPEPEKDLSLPELTDIFSRLAFLMDVGVLAGTLDALVAFAHSRGPDGKSSAPSESGTTPKIRREIASIVNGDSSTNLNSCMGSALGLQTFPFHTDSCHDNVDSTASGDLASLASTTEHSAFVLETPSPSGRTSWGFADRASIEDWELEFLLRVAIDELWYCFKLKKLDDVPRIIEDARLHFADVPLAHEAPQS